MLTRPILIAISSFNATQSKVFNFTIQNNGNQIVANQLTVRNQIDNSIVYQEKQNTFKYEHILPADVLSNGQYYNADIMVFDSYGNSSAISLPIQFYCYTTPTIKFTNIPANEIINNASYNFQFQYNQNESEKLNSFVFNLYNSSKLLISTSNEVYVNNGTPPYDGSYLIAGFEDKAVYYIQVVGKTINNNIIATELTRITIEYSKPNLFTLLELKNNCEEGYIQVTSNIVLVSGDYNPDPPIFINGKEIDLTGTEAYIEWNQGYKITNDFLTRIWFRSPNPYSDILQFSNVQGQTIKLKYMLGYENVTEPNLKAYIKVIISSLNGMEYTIFSNYINILSSEKYYNIQFERENNLYQIGLAEIKE